MNKLKLLKNVNPQNDKCHACNKDNMVKIFYNLRICQNCLLVSRSLSKEKIFEIEKKFQSASKYWQENSETQIKKRGKKNYYFFKKLLTYVTLKKKDKILDIGSGYGPLLELVKNEYDIVGLEPNARNYKISKKMGHNVLNTFLKKNTFKPKTFKAIISLFTLTYITNFDQMLKTIKKILKDNGCILFRVHQYKFSNHIHNFESFIEKDKDESTQVSFFSNNSLRNIFQIHNLEIIYFESNLNGTTVILKKNKVQKPYKKFGNYKFEIFYLKYLVLFISKLIRNFIKIRSHLIKIFFR